MRLEDMTAVEYTDNNGTSHKVLITEDMQDPTAGIPLLDLNGLALPPDMEIRFRQALWAVGIKEYADALKPGAGELVGAALRSALRVSVQDVLLLCQGESQHLKEAGYAR